MKTRILQLLGVAAIATIGMSSCDTDACSDVTCNNGGICVDGDCVCATGYEGTNCDTEERADFIGSYTFTDACFPNQAAQASMISTSSASVTRVLISNILGEALGGTASAEIDGDVISIPNQTVTDVDGDVWTVQGTGTGTLTNGTFAVTVQFTFGTNSQTCVLTFNAQ